MHFTDSNLWLRAHLLSLRIHLATEPTDVAEPSDLRVELRCAAVGLPATISQALRTPVGPAASRLWCLALTTAVETEELLFLCRDAGLISVEAAAPLLEEIDVLVRALNPLATPDAQRRSRLPPPAPPPRPVLAPKALSSRSIRRNGPPRVH
jgi:four helix bundle protein